VVPGAQICRRSRKSCEKHEYRTPECSNSGRDKGDSGACSLGGGAPNGASKSETSLRDKNEDSKHSRPYPVGREVLHKCIDEGYEDHPCRTTNQHDRSESAQSVQPISCDDRQPQDHSPGGHNSFRRPPRTRRLHYETARNCTRSKASQQDSITDSGLTHASRDCRQQREKCA
jgi:hypothetical protein